ncbi:MAG: hypothetical protein Q8L28_01095 [bacterium]|nr:hypothetical protein [bacterium]
MHAYLLISQNSNVKSQTEDLGKKLSAKIMDFPLAKIEDVRNLNNLLRLSFTEPTLIVCRDIHEATEEALNAFLKNLEEPQENIYFVLTAPSVRKVLPTIVSRCQVIRIMNQESGILNKENIEQFLKQTAGQKLAFFDKMRERDKAKEFIEGLIFYLHEKHDLKNMEILLQTLTRLKLNGNVSLQLTNLVVRMSNQALQGS